MDSQIEEIKNKLNVLDVVSGYVKLTKTGINYRGVCPFHSERKPSFFVSPTRQMWHCFGCGAGSSIFDFIMKIEGVEFADALRILANKAGVQLKRENKEVSSQRQRLYEICELACSFFEKQLEASAIGKEAKAYLLSRGITQESIKKWRLGYSPDTWNGLTDFLISKNYRRDEIVKAGLAIEKEGGRGDSYDRFRGRIMFPVFGLNSEVLGFGGRVFKQGSDKEVAKYINTPQTLLYDKSGILYGLNQAKLAVRKQNQCVVTEGYTDVIMCHQAGFENTVAASGTALTEKHLTILKRYSDNLILAFDMDVAGDSATKRGIQLAQEQGFNLKIINSYGEGNKKSDPAEIILKDVKIWQEVLDGARSIMDYYFDSAFAKFDQKTPEGKKDIAKILLPVIKKLPNKIEQAHWVQKLSEMIGIKEEAIREELANIKVEVSSPSAPVQETKKIVTEDQSSRKKLLEEKVVALILKNPDGIYHIDEAGYALFSEEIKSVLLEIKKVVDGKDLTNQEEIKKELATVFNQDTLAGQVNNFMAALALKADVEFEEDGKEELALCLKSLKSIIVKEKLEKISADIHLAETLQDSAKVSSLIEEFNQLTKEL